LFYFAGQRAGPRLLDARAASYCRRKGHERIARAITFCRAAALRGRFPCGAAMVAWIVWLIVAAVLGVAELATTTFALGIIAVAALVAAAVGAVHLGLPFQLLAFIIASGAGLGFVLPIARRHLKQPPLLKTGPAALVGRSAQVLEEVTGNGGRVRIGGEVWSARSYDESLVIPAGAAVDVMQIEGATALVYPRE
jgi:membrane protein implicated in regulation of membrane protease activity